MRPHNFRIIPKSPDTNIKVTDSGFKLKESLNDERMFILILKGNETYNDVIKEAKEIAKINGFDDYYITADVGTVSIWEKCRKE